VCLLSAIAAAAAGSNSSTIDVSQAIKLECFLVSSFIVKRCSEMVGDLAGVVGRRRFVGDRAC